MRGFADACLGAFGAILATTLVGCGGGGSVPPMLTVSPSSLTFKSTFGGTGPAAVPVTVSNMGGAATFVVSSDSPWLTVTPASGTTPQTIQVSATLGSLTTATYSGHINVAPASTQGSPASIAVTLDVAGPPASNAPFWSQWGANPQHTGMVNTAGQKTANRLADIVYDQFASQESAETAPLYGEAALTVHYQAPLIDGNDVYIVQKGGTYTSCNPAGAWQNGVQCGPSTWDSMTWSETRYTWENGKLIQIWSFLSDWKPASASINGAGIGVVEPVFHPAEANGFLYVPGASGTIWRVNKDDGTSASHINPFNGTNIDAKNTFVASPLTPDAAGNIYYNVIELADPNGGKVDPWGQDAVNSWLVKVTPQDVSSAVTYATLTPNAPAGSASTCPVVFFFDFDPKTTLPWPPAVNTPTSTQVCGSQRPGMNLAPAVATDGTVYTASRAHFRSLESWMIAVNPDLSLKWATSMKNLLHDGCGVIVAVDDSSNANVNGCRFGATPGVDPTTNAPGSGSVEDQGSSSPTVLPDSSVVLGVITEYNAARGHLLHFDAQGNFLNSYDFGWDSTPAVYTRADGTFSLVIKDNHYPVPFYCGGNNACQNVPAVYYISQVNPNKPDPLIPEKMLTEWSFQSTNTNSCKRNPDGTVSCTSDHPNGFEWCINMPAVDMHGNVYVNSEDGNLYAIPQGNSGVFTQPTGNLFLSQALSASYTPLTIGPDGKFYTQNNGHLFVVGN